MTRALKTDRVKHHSNKKTCNETCFNGPCEVMVVSKNAYKTLSGQTPHVVDCGEASG
jgi:hypothetical protein